MSIDKAVKEYRKNLKETDTTLKELEARAAEITATQDARHEAEQRFGEAQAELEGVAFERDRVKGELHEATILNDPRADVLRDRYIELTDREQALRETLGDATKAVDENTPDSSEVAELTTRLKRFRSPSVDDVVKAIKEDAQGHARDVQERVQATLSQLPTVDPRSTHEALKASDEHYRNGEGKTLDEYLANEDDKGNVQQATAMLASRLEARDRRAVIAARK